MRAAYPELKEFVVEASRALAALDAGRLEELASSCRALNRELPAGDAVGFAELRRQARCAQADMVVLAGVLGVTRANLAVIRQVRDLRRGRLEYGEGELLAWAAKGSEHGDN
jgi:hypothetical protein